VRIGRALAWVALALVLSVAWAYVSHLTTWSFVRDAPAQGRDLAARAWPPDLAYAAEIARPLADTIHMATLGTILAMAIASPLAMLAARNTTPHPLVRRATILVLVATRSVNSLIWALILVAVLGPGLAAGILAIALRSIGFVGKLLSEAVEETDPRPIEAIAATGARRLQVMWFGFLPRLAPAVGGVALFRWDINVREATILGLVGAGGIGLPLDACVQSLAWSRVATILLAILALVLAGETASARIRKRLA